MILSLDCPDAANAWRGARSHMSPGHLPWDLGRDQAAARAEGIDGAVREQDPMSLAAVIWVAMVGLAPLTVVFFSGQVQPWR